MGASKLTPESRRSRNSRGTWARRKRWTNLNALTAAAAAAQARTDTQKKSMGVH